MTQDSLSSTILDSAISAFQEYTEMTDGDCGVAHTPEYWYTTKIGTGIKKVLSDYAVILECPLEEFNEYSETNPGRPFKKARVNGRADITLWNHKNGDDWKAHCIIEVKKGWGWKKGEMGNDVTRICDSIKRNTNVNIGYFVVLTDAEVDDNKSTENPIMSKLEEPNSIKHKIIDKAKHYGLSVTMYHRFAKTKTEDNYVTAALVFEFTQE